MQALIILSLLVFYLLDQLVGQQGISAIGWRLLGVCSVLAVGPLATAGLTAWLHRLPASSSSVERGRQQLSIGLWFASGLLLIGLLNWGAIVRQVLGSAASSPVDLIALYLPLVLALMLGWGAQCLVECSLNGSALSTRDQLRQCRRYVSIRSAVYLVPAVVPLAAVIAAQSMGRWISTLSGRGDLELWVSAGLIVLFIGWLPLVLSACWRARPLPPGKLRGFLDNTLRQRGVRFRDIRIWPTSNQMTNAMVVGMFPKWRILVLTDRLLRLLTLNQLAMVIAHEAGHVRGRHLPLRLYFVLLPLLFAGAFRWAFGGTLFPDPQTGWLSGFESSAWSWLVVLILYATYAFLVIGWSSQWMELQADLFACLAPSGRPAGVRVELAKEFQDALLVLAEDAGEDAARRGWLHPSVFDRVHSVRFAAADPRHIDTFHRRFAWEKLAATLVGMLVGAVIGLA
jgi:Zn-dependent protease with chaperone function